MAIRWKFAMTLAQVLTIAAFAVLIIAINAFYVAAEFSALAARKSRIANMAAAGEGLAKRLLPIIEDRHKLDKFIVASQVGITASSLVLGAYGLFVAQTWLAPLLTDWGWFAEAAVLSISGTVMLITFTTLQVILGETLPKSLALQFPEHIAKALVLPMQLSLAILGPFIWLLRGSSVLILKFLNRYEGSDQTPAHSPAEIEMLIDESYKSGQLDDMERQMLRNALRLRNLVARQVMVPRNLMTALPATTRVDEIIRRSQEVGISRIPLYDASIDNIIGFVHIKDLLRLKRSGQQQATAKLRSIVFVPETLPITEVWHTLSQQRKYLAVVFDEYGGTAGLLTIEDMIEEIIGELQDEFDQEVALASADSDGRYHLRGDLLVSDVNEYLSMHLPVNEADTVGGLVFTTLGRIPEVGDEVAVDGTTVRIEAMDGLRITEISLWPNNPGLLTDITEWLFDDGYEAPPTHLSGADE